MDKLIEEANSIFSKDRFATQATGITIQSITDDEVVCTLNIEEKHLNAAGTVMGGAIYTLADFTFAVASNFHKNHTVTLTSQISYLGVAKGHQLVASSSCIKSGRTTCFYLITITDDLGNQVACVHMNGFIMQNKL